MKNKLPRVDVKLRLPLDLWEQLTKDAEANGRSLNGEIVYWLRQHIGAKP